MLIAEEQLMYIDALSHSNDIDAIVVMKHSTRCSISSMALSRLERSWNVSEKKVPTYFLDILKHRDLSNKLAETYNLQHESPQILVIKNGKCIYSATHSEISAPDISAAILNS